jgi:hypothetical protein
MDNGAQSEHNQNKIPQRVSKAVREVALKATPSKNCYTRNNKLPTRMATEMKKRALDKDAIDDEKTKMTL